MKFLSLSRPWDWAIFDPVAAKDIENRSWPPPIGVIGQDIALQSAGSWDKRAMPTFTRLGLDNFPERFSLYPSGVIRGVVTIERVVTTDNTLTPTQKRWRMPEFGEYAWVLGSVTPFRTFVPCKGAQGLRTLPEDVEVEVRRALAAARIPRT